jgi:hypothetical protein
MGFAKTMSIYCDADDCDLEELVETGRDATIAKVIARARNEGWAISSAGHFCPEHRRRNR